MRELKKLSIQYRKPVRGILKLSSDTEQFKDANMQVCVYALIDQLFDIEMRVVTKGNDCMKDLRILQRVRSIIVSKASKLS